MALDKYIHNIDQICQCYEVFKIFNDEARCIHMFVLRDRKDKKKILW
jgi:hypothetical protein